MELQTFHLNFCMLSILWIYQKPLKLRTPKGRSNKKEKVMKFWIGRRCQNPKYFLLIWNAECYWTILFLWWKLYHEATEDMKCIQCSQVNPGALWAGKACPALNSSFLMSLFPTCSNVPFKLMQFHKKWKWKTKYDLFKRKVVLIF